MGNILYIVMPAYNEEAEIAAAVDNWYSKILRGGGKRGVQISGSGQRQH